MAAVLFTTTLDGTTDYAIEGDVQVVLVDFRDYSVDTSFPADVDRDIDNVCALPEMPWKAETIRFLAAKKVEIIDAINSEPPPPELPDETV